MTVALVAIAKNEGRFLTEWLAYHLRLGFDRIFVYDNESNDDSARILDSLAEEYPVKRIPWLSEPKKSPQIAAYNHALANHLSGYDWVAFVDCDEFIVLHEDADMAEFLERFGDDVGAVALNWITFGSDGQKTCDYELVTQTFRSGPHDKFGNNHHIKTIARVGCIESMAIHHAELKTGRWVHASGAPLTMSKTKGIADLIDHRIAHLNHYQIKSREDFDQKIARGRAGASSDDPNRVRPNAETLWKAIDRSEQVYNHIDERMPLFLPMYEQFRRILNDG